jgi:hypothetical protein
MTGSIGGMGGVSLPKVVSGASKRGSKSHGLADLFKSVDSTGSGSITKSQLQSALPNLKLPSSVKSLGADAIFGKLDPNNTGSVSPQDFVTGLRKIMADPKVQTTKPAQAASSSPFDALISGAKAIASLGAAATGPVGSSIGSLINTFA